MPDRTFRTGRMRAEGNPLTLGAMEELVLEARQHVLSTNMVIGTAGQDGWVRMPFKCRVVRIDTVLEAAIITANEVITVRNGSGGSSLGTITIATASSASGDVDSLEPTANTDFDAGDLLHLDPDGASGGANVNVFVQVIRL